MDECEECVDKYLVAPILPLLETELSRAYQDLSDLLPVLKVSSASVERAHLVGEEKKPVRARGRAVSAPVMCTRSYQGFWLIYARKVSASILNMMMKRRALSRITFANVIVNICCMLAKFRWLPWCFRYKLLIPEWTFNFTLIPPKTKKHQQ